MDAQKKAILESGAREIIQKGQEDFVRRIVACVASYSKTAIAAEVADDVLVHNVAEVADESLVTVDSLNKTADFIELNSESPLAQPLPIDDRPYIPPQVAKVVTKSDFDEIAIKARLGLDPMESVRDWVEKAGRAVSELVKQVRQLDRDADYIEQANEVFEGIRSANKRLRGNGTGPASGESMGHWATNVLMSCNTDLDLLSDREQHDFFGQLSDPIAVVQGHLKNAFDSIAKVLERNLNDVPQFKDDESMAQPEPVCLGSILIVDDSPDARLDLERKVRRLKYHVVSCESAFTALEILKSQRFDVCLIDMSMPEMSGLEMIRRIRANPRTAKLPVIVISGSSQSNVAAEAIEMGADDFLTKPAVERLLKARINFCLRQTQTRRDELAKFLPMHVVESVLTDDDVLHRPKLLDISVMICDIRGFSRISEGRNPVETISWISDVMNCLSKLILDSGGTIVDYVGDEIMAMWGAPRESNDHAQEACSCAVAIQDEVDRLSKVWFPKLGVGMQIGIGINSGIAVCGNTGSAHRIKYGPLGNTVNLASRVQGTTKYLHSSILVTGETANRIATNLRGRRIRNIRVQNIAQPIQLVELAMPGRLEQEQLAKEYAAALTHFESKELSEACSILSRLIQKHPDDGPSKLLMLHVLQAELGGTFDPIWTMPGK